VNEDTPYPFRGHSGRAWEDFNTLFESGEIQRYPLFWRDFALQLRLDISQILSEKNNCIHELRGKLSHYETVEPYNK
jgi:hypothetical protein